MNLTQLRAFDAIVRTGSFTAAAQQLHISQPAVTSHIRQLEAYYQVSLFRRQGRRVVPTDLGVELAEVARELFHHEERAVDLLEGHRRLRRGTLRLAADGPYRAVPLVAAFRERYPGIRVSLWIGSTGAVQEAIIEERCDLAVQAHVQADERLLVVELSSENIIVFVSADHPWARAGRSSVHITELDAQPIVIREPGSTTRRRFDEACTQAGVSPDLSIETTSRETVKEAVAANLGIGVIAREELRADERFWPLAVEGADMRYTDQVVCLRRRAELRLLREFLYLAERHAAELAAG